LVFDFLLFCLKHYFYLLQSVLMRPHGLSPSMGVGSRGQWRSKEAVGAHALGAQQQLFAVILNVFLSRNLDQSMLKYAYFLGKNCKNRLSVEGSAPEPPFASEGWGLSPQTPRCYSPYYYKFVEFVSSVKCILFRSKKNQVTTANVLPLFLPHFYTYFLIQTL